MLTFNKFTLVCTGVVHQAYGLFHFHEKRGGQASATFASLAGPAETLS